MGLCLHLTWPVGAGPASARVLHACTTRLAKMAVIEREPRSSQRLPQTVGACRLAATTPGLQTGVLAEAQDDDRGMEAVVESKSKGDGNKDACL